MNLTLTCTPPAHPSLAFEISVHGSIDARTASELLSCAVDALAEGHDLVIDAAGIDFIDCDGANTFVKIGAIAEQEQRRFTLAARSARLQFVLDLVDLGDQWTTGANAVSNTA